MPDRSAANGRSACARSIDDVMSHPPITAGMLNMDRERRHTTRLRALALVERTADNLLNEDLPVKDLTAWITGNFPEKGTADDMLLGLSRLLFDPKLDGRPSRVANRNTTARATACLKHPPSPSPKSSSTSAKTK
jgi:hypothetical protein